MPDTALPAKSNGRLLDAIRAVVGDRGLLTDSSDTAPVRRIGAACTKAAPTR